MRPELCRSYARPNLPWCFGREIARRRAGRHGRASQLEPAVAANWRIVIKAAGPPVSCSSPTS